MVDFNAINDINDHLKSTDILVCVSKKQDIKTIKAAYDFGIRDFGENVVSEFVLKFQELPNDIRWHFIGHLQSNKVKQIVGKTFLIHSLDRISLLKQLENHSEKLNITTNVLVQVNISKELQKGGVLLEDIEVFLRTIEECKYLKVKGLMAIGSTDLNEAREEFKKLKEKWDEIDKLEFKNIKMEYLSMGMSDDFKLALECGSNLIRVGTRIFGSRNKK